MNDGELRVLGVLEIVEAGGVLGDEEGLELSRNNEWILKLALILIISRRNFREDWGNVSTDSL